MLSGMAVGSMYSVAWYERDRAGYQGRQLAVKVGGCDGMDISALHTVPDDWEQKSATFKATATTTELCFTTPGGTADGSVFLDLITTSLQGAHCLRICLTTPTCTSTRQHTPGHMAPHHSTPHYTTPHHTTPHHTTPHHTTLPPGLCRVPSHCHYSREPPHLFFSVEQRRCWNWACSIYVGLTSGLVCGHKCSWTMAAA